MIQRYKKEKREGIPCVCGSGAMAKYQTTSEPNRSANSRTDGNCPTRPSGRPSRTDWRCRCASYALCRRKDNSPWAQGFLHRSRRSAGTGQLLLAKKTSGQTAPSSANASRAASSVGEVMKRHSAPRLQTLPASSWKTLPKLGNNENDRKREKERGYSLSSQGYTPACQPHG